jgi:hypothetical protein
MAFLCQEHFPVLRKFQRKYATDLTVSTQLPLDTGRTRISQSTLLEPRRFDGVMHGKLENCRQHVINMVCQCYDIAIIYYLQVSDSLAILLVG